VILALLPGLEEEHGEYFDKTLDVIDQIRLAVKEEESFFWQCMWLAIATSAEQRVGACNYCLKRMESLDKSSNGNIYEMLNLISRDIVCLSRSRIIHSVILCGTYGFKPPGSKRIS
jgi:hypothetical protein